LAPGANACQSLDIMSVTERCAGAETFAAVKPRYKGKLALYLFKLTTRPERHRHVFFMSRLFQGNKHLPQFKQHCVQVRSVDVYSALAVRAVVSSHTKPALLRSGIRSDTSSPIGNCKVLHVYVR
jgi:hypothetical protein